MGTIEISVVIGISVVIHYWNNRSIISDACPYAKLHREFLIKKKQCYCNFTKKNVSNSKSVLNVL